MKNKVLKYVFLGLLISLGIYILVSFIVNKDGTMYWIEKIYGWLNEPLPIVGVSSAALFIFSWNVVKYIRETKPNQELQEMKKEHDKYKQESEQEKQELKELCLYFKEQLISVCELSTNQKINDFGKELEKYGEETIDGETKAK